MKEHDFRFNEKLTEEKKKRSKSIVHFVRPELVATRFAAGGVFKNTQLKHEITAAAIELFIKENRKYLKMDGNNFIFDPKCEEKKKEFAYEKKLKELKERFDADIIEYNDFESDSELLYSIIVNRSEERVTVVFRGSVTIKDFFIDAMCFQTNPEEIKTFETGGTKVHSGFVKYLFGKLNGRESKYEQILKALEEVYEYKASGRDYSNYELFITGHSLGGALAQLLAFVLAGSEKVKFLPVGKPVTAMTYASPETGNDGYLNTFKKLEKEGALRHLRISNNGDVVPFGYNLIACLLGYKQPGVNIHLFEDELADVKKDRIKKGFFNPIHAIKMHGLDTYKSRLFTEKNEEITIKSVEDFYSEFSE